MRVMIGLVGLATAAALAACGGDGSDGATSAATDYASCLRANGVTFPSGGAGGRPSGGAFPSGGPGGMDGAPPSSGPSGGATGRPGGGFGGPGGGGFGTQAPNGVDQATWEKAQKACEGLRSSGAPGGGGNRGDNGAQAAYRTCLTDHGVTVTGGINNLDATDPKVAEAMAACAPLRPSGAPTPTPPAGMLGG